MLLAIQHGFYNEIVKNGNGFLNQAGTSNSLPQVSPLEQTDSSAGTSFEFNLSMET